MQTQEPRDLRRLLWPAVLNGVCAAIVASFIFIALGYLHPALALPPIGLGVLGALAMSVRLPRPDDLPPSDAAENPPADPATSA